MRRVLLAVLAAFLCLAAVPPGTATADKGEVDLWVSAHFDDVAYLPGAQVRMEVTVQNNGTVPATGVVLHSTGDLTFEGWGELDPAGPGVELAPGGGRSFRVTAYVSEDAADLVQTVEAVAEEPDRNPADNTISASAFVTAKVCDLTLTLHTDSDNDGVLEPGETLGGVEIKLMGGLSRETLTARTDAHGVVRFPGIAGGRYWLTTGLSGGWYVGYNEVRLRPGQNDVVVRAQPVDLSKVVASVAFDRDTYAVGDTVRQRVTITNNGTVDVSGLIAKCSSYNVEGSGENELNSVGWGELDGGSAKPGATVRAGETRVWEFTSEVTQRMWDYGSVILRCYFLLDGMTKGAFAMDRASVPGGRGTLGGLAWTAGQQPVPGVKILLIGADTGTITARATTGADGQFRFPDVPTGSYKLAPTGRWRLADEKMELPVLAGFDREIALQLVSGPLYDPDAPPPQSPQPPPPPTVSPAPQASPAPHPQALAHTGADVVELLAFGALFVVSGAALLRVRRRNCV
jgi:hypothetical protein